MRGPRCGFDGTFCGGTVFVGLREDNVTLLRKVSCFSRTQKALKDSTYIVGAFEVSDKHSSVIGMNAQLFVQQELKVLSSFSIVHWYDIRVPRISSAQHATCLKDIKSAHTSFVLLGFRQEGGTAASF